MCFVVIRRPTSKIGESFRLVQDIIEYVDREEDEAILFSTDIEKAFDSVNHNFIFASLEKFGFGPEFIRCVKTLLKMVRVV